MASAIKKEKRVCPQFERAAIVVSQYNNELLLTLLLSDKIHQSLNHHLIHSQLRSSSEIISILLLRCVDSDQQISSNTNQLSC